MKNVENIKNVKKRKNVTWIKNVKKPLLRLWTTLRRNGIAVGEIARAEAISPRLIIINRRRAL